MENTCTFVLWVRHRAGPTPCTWHFSFSFAHGCLGLSIIPLFSFTIFVYDAQIQNGQPIVSYHIRYLTFLCVKSASLPCPWCVPVVFMPYLGSLVFVPFPQQKVCRYWEVSWKRLSSFTSLIQKTERKKGQKFFLPHCNYFLLVFPYFFQLLSKVLHHICGRNFSFKKLYQMHNW